MKVTYNWLKDFVDIRLAPEALADKLTMAGLEVKAIDRFEDDYVFEIEITSNRPDWLSVIGIAREAAAVTGKKLRVTRAPEHKSTGRSGRRLPAGKAGTTDDGRPKIFITDKKACPFYSARVISDVKIGPSPDWMAKRLKAVGLRPINNVVDITNYVLWTTGQPLHAFDLDKIAGAKISVRFAQDGEEIVTIDGVKRKLSSDILVIADENRPAAIAGIMGGKDTEVNEATKNILLESAYFSPLGTRKAARLLALSSDSAYRFERSVDITRVVSSSDLAAGLIQKYAQGKIGGLYQSGLRPKKSSKVITFNLSQANKLIGREIPLVRAKAIFKTLEFSCHCEERREAGRRSNPQRRLLRPSGARNDKTDILKITPPVFRQDISSDVDLVEELCRIYGYENIPLSLAAVRHQAIEEDRLIFIRKKARDVLTALGYSEAITYSLLSQEILNKIGLEDSGSIVMRQSIGEFIACHSRESGNPDDLDSPVKPGNDKMSPFTDRLRNIICLENPLSALQEVLRPGLSVGLLGVLARNMELGNKNQGFFELGDCFLKDDESLVLGLIEEGGLLELKGKLELLLDKLGILDYSFKNISYPLFCSGQSASLTVSAKEAGIIGQISPEVLRNFKIDNNQVVYCQLNLDALKPYVSFDKAYAELPRYPAVIRDLTLIAQEQVAYQGILDLIKTAQIKELEAIKFKDLYRSESLGKDKKSITISLEFRLPEATLTDSRVNGYMERIIQAFTLNPGIALR